MICCKWGRKKCNFCGHKVVLKNNFVPTKLFVVRNSCKYNHTYLKNFLEKSKIALLDFSPDLPQGFREKGEFPRSYKGVPLKIAERGRNRRRAKRTAVSPSKSRKKFYQLKTFFVNHLLRVPKPRFWQSAPHWPHTCGFCRKSEFARSLKRTSSRKQNHAFAQRNPICARAPQRVNAARILKGVPRKARRRGQRPQKS